MSMPTGEHRWMKNSGISWATFGHKSNALSTALPRKICEVGFKHCTVNRYSIATILTHFSLSSQLLLHRFMDLNEAWQGYYTTSLEVHLGR